MRSERESVVSDEAAGSRLDTFLACCFGDLSRSRLQKLIEEGQVEVSGEQKKKSNYRVKEGQVITLTLPVPKSLDVLAEDIELEVLYEDGDIILLNKPRGMVVHPAPGHEQGTLVNALLHYCGDLSGIGGINRPGIVHRLDKDTSGVMVVAKNDFAHLCLTSQLKERHVKKVYLAVVRGKMKKQKGTINLPIGRHQKDRKRMTVRIDGRESITHYHVCAYMGGYTLLEVRLATGRTHQVRVHFAYMGFPIAGDPVYGGRSCLPIKGQMLHSRLLGFSHPRTGEYMESVAPIPLDFRRVLKYLR